MATPRRRSARLSKAAQQKRSSPRKATSALVLESLVERDETPEVGGPQSIDNVLSTPTSAAEIQSQLSKLSGLKTPRTEPRVDQAEMHPELVHQTTAKAPDSGLKLGFVDLPAQPLLSVASAQNTPSKAYANTPVNNLPSSRFDFKFGSESQLSTDAQKLMDNVREEAVKLKAQMQAERDAQQQRDAAAPSALHGVNASGRKMAQPRGKASRFSDVHMAQFKKMDSIANHPSAYRARPGFAQPTAQSLKRSGSKAGLDELDRPRTAGKGMGLAATPAVLGRPTSVSPFKSIPGQAGRTPGQAPAKRAKNSEKHDGEDVPVTLPVEAAQSPRLLPTARPVSSSLLSPTKASLARAAASQIPVASPTKPTLTRSPSARSLHQASATLSTKLATVVAENVQQPQPSSESSRLRRPLPTLPLEKMSPSTENPTVLATTAREGDATVPASASRLPTWSGLKSILRTGRKSGAAPSTADRNGTPKRPNTATSTSESVKKVDFTPSVKSRYAVKLAAGSPSPAKLPQLTPGPAAPVVPYDPAAYVLQDDDGDENWEDAESEIEYPVLPPVSSSPAQPRGEDAFAGKAKAHSRRESKDFKSIFTTLHHPSRPAAPSTLTSVNTIVNQTDPTIHANKVGTSLGPYRLSQPSPSTIRRVRSSGVTDLVQPFEDANVGTVPHGLPAKKRRHESAGRDEEPDKENQRISLAPAVPGSWQEPEEKDEGQTRGGKRARVDPGADLPGRGGELKSKVEVTKKARPSSARELAKNNARDRKGILSLSRLNMLSRPKQRP